MQMANRPTVQAALKIKKVGSLPIFSFASVVKRFIVFHCLCYSEVCSSAWVCSRVWECEVEVVWCEAEVEGDSEEQEEA